MTEFATDFGKSVDSRDRRDRFAREKDRSLISIDWDEIAKKRRERILWEIEQGLDPIEAPEVTGDSVQETTSSSYSRSTEWINRDGAPRKYDHDEVIRLYRDEGWSGKKIAKKMGANPATIYGILRQNNIERRAYRGGRNQFNS